jgi:hypothetical protein
MVIGTRMSESSRINSQPWLVEGYFSFLNMISDWETMVIGTRMSESSRINSKTWLVEGYFSFLNILFIIE